MKRSEPLKLMPLDDLKAVLAKIVAAGKPQPADKKKAPPKRGRD